MWLLFWSEHNICVEYVVCLNLFPLSLRHQQGFLDSDSFYPCFFSLSIFFSLGYICFCYFLFCLFSMLKGILVYLLMKLCEPLGTHGFDVVGLPANAIVK